MYSPDQGGVYAASIILIVASTGAVALRVLARRLRKTPLGADDFTIVIALALVWGLAAINLVGAGAGSFGTNTFQDPKTGKTVTTWHENQVAKLSYSSQVLNVLADGTIKLSLLLTYKRMFVGKVFTAFTILSLCFIAAWTTAFFFGTVFVCGQNPAWQWTSVQTITAHCGSIKYVWLSHAVTDVITDILVMFIPLPLIWQLHMRASAKVALLGIFALGFLSTGAGTARLVYVAKDVYETTTGFRDVRAVQTNISIWGMVESGVGVITACLVTYRPFMDMRAVESVIDSVRSAFSLASLSRRASNEKSPPNTVSLTVKPDESSSQRKPSVQSR